MGGQKGQIHPAFNFKVGIIAKACEEGLHGQSVNPEPEPKAAAERALAALTAHSYSQQTNTSQGDSETKTG